LSSRIVDTADNREWLTGFSKRKKAKIEEKRSRAKERDHQAHLDERRKVCHLSMADLPG
jgi:ribosomal RNA-processing protein 17